MTAMCTYGQREITMSALYASWEIHGAALKRVKYTHTLSSMLMLAIRFLGTPSRGPLRLTGRTATTTGACGRITQTTRSTAMISEACQYFTVKVTLKNGRVLYMEQPGKQAPFRTREDAEESAERMEFNDMVKEYEVLELGPIS
jgi:hypothetical protein